MSELKATPGPYRAEGPDRFRDFNILHDGDSLAIGAVVSNMRAPEEVKANADLLAASFDLYEVLDEILTYSGGANNALGDEYVMERAHAALAKARGDGT
jgi:hypothetical protein